jgi:hypothetical protein
MSATLIRQLLACTIASALIAPHALATDHCCHSAPAAPAILLPTPLPCCGNPPLLYAPLLHNHFPTMPAAVLSGGTVVNAFGSPIPGIHADFPYYSYRAPWAPPGPPHLYRTIAW